MSIFGNSIMQIRKKWLTNRKTFLTNIVKNIIWHHFAGESHQVVHVSVIDLYIPTIGPHILIGRPIVNRSQKHECRNWDRGRAVSFLGIFVLNFWI